MKPDARARCALRSSVALALLLALLPLRCRCREFWVTLANYIGLYSSSRSAWCCSPASPG